MATQKQPGPPTKQADQPKETKERKAWRKKTPVEIVLDQADKLRREIADDEAALNQKKRQLQKFEEARKLFET